MTIGTRYNYYEILEVSPHCHPNEISAAYEKAKSTYSGENPAIYTLFSEQEARELLRLIEEAYEVLSNKTLRALYDEKLGKSASAHLEISVENLKEESRALSGYELKKESVSKPNWSIDPKKEEEVANITVWSGSALQMVREYKNYSIQLLSQITKINQYYIIAIEKNDTQNLPAPVFIRGYVAQIAKTLGLNEKSVCDSYMKTLKKDL